MTEQTIVHEVALAGYKATSTGGMLDLGTWGSYGIEKLHLTLDAAWQDLTITAFFNVKGEVAAKKVVGKDGYADVPWEATKENTLAGRIVFEGSINGRRRISANLNYKVTNHSEITDSDPVPTDDRWNQFVTENKEYRDGAFEAAERANARAEDAEAASDDAQAAARAAKASKTAANASENAAAESASNAAASAASAASAAKKAADESVAANIAVIEKMQADVASKQTAAAASEKTASAAAAVATDAKAAAVAAQKDAAASKTAAAKSAADANSTANSINDSMTQIAANKEAVSRLKEDTTALQKRQNVLVGSETGNPVSCDDAFAAPLCGLTVYGKSTQNGTPSPDNPVPIVSAGDSGTIVLTLGDGGSKTQTLTLPTPNGLLGIPVTSGGNYTDQNGQQWVCDEVDLERGVRVQRITTIVFSDKKKFGLRTTDTSTKVRFSAAADGLKAANLTTADSSAFCSALALGTKDSTWTTPNTFTIGSDVELNVSLYIRFENINSLDELQQYLQRTPMSLTAILATPIETPLTPAEIAAYKAITAYAPDTVVQAGDGAGFKLEYQKDVNIAIKKLEDAIASMTTP